MRKYLFSAAFCVMGYTAAISQGTGFYPINPVPFTQVEITDPFLSRRSTINREVTIPYSFSKYEETGQINTFMVPGGIIEGKYNTRRGFDDSDVYRIINKE